MSAQTERKAYKDWFDAEAAARLGAQVRAVHPAFPEKEFHRRALKELHALEFHARIEQFSGALRSTLPEEVPVAIVLTLGWFAFGRQNLRKTSRTDGTDGNPQSRFRPHHRRNRSRA